MRIWQKIIASVAVFVAAVLLTACGSHQEANNQIRVGTISGPETQLMQVAQSVALQKYGLQVNIVQFTDYNLPNQALADGSIDVNMFQHMPYLSAAMAANHYDFTPVGKTFIYPVGMYSYKHTNLNQLGKNAIIAIPNDPTNEARALLLMQKAGLIKLKPKITVTATVNDILSNPKHFQIKELDAAQLPRVLPDVDLAVINSNYALPAGLRPTVGPSTDHKNALYLEGTDSLYANLFVARTADKNDPKIQELVSAFQSPQVLAAAQNIFKGDAIKAW
jgi:D-methionine transport system substrate-binding protein